MIDVSQDYEYDTRISPQDMAWYGLKEGEMIRLIGGVCVNKKEYYEICEQKKQWILHARKRPKGTWGNPKEKVD